MFKLKKLLFHKPLSLFLTYLVAITLYSSLNAEDKILIMTYVHSRPDFIDLHIKTFNAFLQDEYRYVVFNDAPNNNMKQQIEETCARLGVECLRVPDHNADRVGKPGHRHIDGIKFSLEQVGFDYDGIVVMIDADMFLIKQFNIKEYLQNYDLIAWYQDREGNGKKVIYMAPSLVFMDMRTLPNKRTINFEGGNIEGLPCDVGGQMYYYFKNNPTLKMKFYGIESTADLPKNEATLKSMGFNQNDIQFVLSLKKRYAGFDFHGDKNFMHFYAGGSNWAGYTAALVQEKTNILNNYIDESINCYKNQ